MFNSCLLLSFLLFQIVHSRSIIHSHTDAIAYLKQYGYTSQQCGNSKLACALSRPNFSSILRDFQRQFKLSVTGRLDYQTRQLMNQPRCGLPDHKSSAASSLLVQNSRSEARWNRRKLTWSFRHDDPTYAYWIKQAFSQWKKMLPQFEFHQVCSSCQADIFLSFKLKTHEHERNIRDEGFKEDDLAHAYSPEDGTVHFNKEVTWTHEFGKGKKMYNFFLVAVHELGHSLGYSNKNEAHNLDEEPSVMFPDYKNWDKDNLFTETDRQIIRALYPDGDRDDGDNKGQIQWKGQNWANGCDFHERNLKNVRTTDQRCGPECSRTDGCTHFTWSRYNEGTCWMKTGVVTKSDAFPTTDQSMVCGVAR